MAITTPDGARDRRIRVLFIEDVENETQIALTQLKRAGMNCVTRRVETETQLRAALRDFLPDVILSDFTLPDFDGLSALRICRAVAVDTPFIFLSGTIGEETAVAALRSGATDYVLKDHLVRLAPAISRALDDAEASAEHRAALAQIKRMDRVLRMQSGISALLIRITDRDELLQEACRLAVSIGGYTAAVAGFKGAGTASLRLVASSGGDAQLIESMRSYINESAGRPQGLVAQLLASGKAFLSTDTSDLHSTTTLSKLMVSSGMLSVAALPLIVDRTPVGILVFVSPTSDVVKSDELAMLKDVAGNLSFAIQYMQSSTRVRFLSHFDPRTGLAQRTLFCERVARLLTAPQNQATRYAVVVMDIEHLSAINDSFGRRIGDLLLQYVADRLKRIYPDTEQLAHFGGGTFALLRDQGDRSEEQMLGTAHAREREAFAEPFQIEGARIPLAMKTGFALFPTDGYDAGTLIQNAEAALVATRAAGVRHLHFNAAARSHLVGQLALEHRVRLAFEQQEFELHYQPKVNVTTRRIQGVEALIRWRDRDNALVSPAQFLPVLESTGLIVDVGDWVIEQAARDAQVWMSAGLAPVRIAVNIAPAQLRNDGFLSHFLAATAGWATRGWGLDIEITEGLLQEQSEAEIGKLKTLRETGVRVAIDDFGTGYSSLSRLASLPIDVLKIDRAFVSHALVTAAGGSLVRTIVSVARAFNMLTVAEGVEQQEQLDFLRQVGCDESQGFFHSPAVEASQLATFLKHGKGTFILPAER